MKNSLELIKSSESVIDRIVSVKKSDDSGGRSVAGDGGGGCGAGAESDSDADGMSSDGGEFGASSSSSKLGSGSSSAKSALKKSKKLKTKLGRTIKNVRKFFQKFLF